MNTSSVSWGALLPLEHCTFTLVGAVTGEPSGPGTTLQGAELRNAILQVADRLPTPSQMVVACADRLNFIVAALAAWARGKVVCLPPSFQPGALEQTARMLGGVPVVTDDDIRWASSCVATAHANTGLDQPFPSDRLMARIFTSGSTGEPRELQKVAGQLLAEACALRQAFAVGPSARFVSVVPPHHIYGLLFGFLVPMVSGACLVAEAPLHPEAISATLQRHGVTHLVSTPAHLHAFSLLEHGSLNPHLRIFSSGAPLPDSTASMLHSRFGITPWEILGSSESGGVAWRAHQGDAPPFKTFAGVRVSCDDDDRMLVSSPWIPRSEASPWRSDDRIAMLADGFSHIGRADDVVKIAGRRISIAEVESRLQSLPGVNDAAVIARPAHDARGHVLAAVVATTTATAEGLRRELRQWFEPVVIPRHIAVVTTLPREATGKLRRDKLSELLDEPDSLHLTPLLGERGRHRFSVTVPSNLRWFRGHFHGEPVLPGVVQLERIVLRAVALVWPELTSLKRIARLKFTRTIGPGEQLELVLEQIHAASIDFNISCGQELCASGSLHFRDDTLAQPE